MSDGGYVAHILTKIDGEPVEPNEPWVLRVQERPGTDAEMLTLLDGSRRFPRAGLTVFATEQEAREDAQRRINEANLANEIYASLQEQETVEIPTTRLAAAFSPDGEIEHFKRSQAERFASKFGWQISQGGAVTGGLVFTKKGAVSE